MTLRVLYFASLAERAGTGEETVDVPPGADVAALWEMLVARHPRLTDLLARPAVACDMDYAGWDRRLDGVAEVAFLPAVSGG